MMTIEEIKQLVNQRIIENYTGDITAEDVNRIMTETLDNLGHQGTELSQLVLKVGEIGYKFGGVITPSSTPIETDVKMAYVAKEKGIYSMFGGIVKDTDNLTLILSDETEPQEPTEDTTFIVSPQTINGLSGITGTFVASPQKLNVISVFKGEVIDFAYSGANANLSFLFSKELPSEGVSSWYIGQQFPATSYTFVAPFDGYFVVGSLSGISESGMTFTAHSKKYDYEPRDLESMVIDATINMSNHDLRTASGWQTRAYRVESGDHIRVILNGGTECRYGFTTQTPVATNIPVTNAIATSDELNTEIISDVDGYFLMASTSASALTNIVGAFKDWTITPIASWTKVELLEDMLNGVEKSTNKVSNLGAPNNTTYPTTKAVADAIAQSGGGGSATRYDEIAFDNLTYSLIATDGAVGSVVNLTPTYNASFGCLVIDVLEGEKFNVKGAGGSTGRLWCFIDTSNKIKTHSSANVAFGEYDIIAPIDGKLIVNYYLTRDISIKKLVPISETSKVESFDAFINDCILENGTINQLGYEPSEDNFKKIRTKNYIDGEHFIICPSDYRVELVAYYNKNDLTFNSSSLLHAHNAHIYKEGCVARLVFNVYLSTAKLNVDDLWHPLSIKSIADKVFIYPPMAHIEIDHELKDVSSLRTSFHESEDVPTQVYTAFDALATSFPNLISVQDAASVAGLEYPTYCNLNGQASGGYLATPTYRLKMYKISMSYPSVGNVNGGSNQKKVCFLTGGVHGDEKVSPCNLYILAYMLCHCMEDVNYFKFLQAFDVYIIPYVNCYGGYHTTRQNANGVDINRAFPVLGWRKTGQMGDVTYSGESPNVEFENKVLTKITEILKPSIAIDHHTYPFYPNRSSQSQFYSETFNRRDLHLFYECLCDCSYAFVKGLPTYFGNAPMLVASLATTPPDETAPADVTGDVGGLICTWWTQQNISMASIVEISDSIHFQNGVNSTSALNVWGNDLFSINEYTLRCQLFRMANLVLENER